MQRERPKSLATLVTDRLRGEIIDGAFEFGEALSETIISRRYEVSRTPVREAFARLELEELVHTEPQIGTYVFTMDRAQFAMISEVRSVLECAALRLAFARNRPTLVKQWSKLNRRLEAAAQRGDGKRYSAADGEFHDLLFVLAENPYLDASRRPFAARMEAIRNRLGLSPEHIAKSRAEHGRLADLVSQGDLDGAVVLLHHHITEKGANFWPEPKTAAGSRPAWTRNGR